MRAFIVLGMVCISLYACKKERSGNFPEDAWVHQLRNLDGEFRKVEYELLKKRIENFRRPLQKQMKGAQKAKWIDRSREYLYTVFCDSLFQFWYDTEWDFNGTTELPGEGKIACGYFVTTTLCHAGFKVERVRLAQQAASVIINTMCKKEHVQIFTNGRRDLLKEYLRKQNPSLFILGLDSHVGFIQTQDTSIYMIHSSGFYPWQVVREPFDQCAAIQNSGFFMIGDFLRNDEVIRKWINQESIAMKNQ